MSELLKSCKQMIRNETNHRMQQYGVTARLVITFPLLVNSGSAIALVNFFMNGNPAQWVSLSAACFVIGAILGLITLALEFTAACTLWRDFIPFLERILSLELTNDEDNLKQELSKHYISTAKYRENVKKVMDMIILIGSLSLGLGLAGICFIYSYIQHSKLSGVILFISTLLLAISMMCWVNKNLLRYSKQ